VESQSPITVYSSTKAEFDRVQPSGMTNDEFVEAMLELWAGQEP